MNSIASAPSELVCEIRTVASAASPARYVRFATQVYPNVRTRPAESVLELPDGQQDILVLGEPRRDLELEVTRIDRESKLVLDDIVMRGLPCFVYPVFPGSVQGVWPFRDRLTGDPSAATWSGMTMTDAQRAYLLQGDPKHGVSLLPLTADTANYASGLYADDGSHAEFPLGHGTIFADNSHKNWIQNARFQSVTSHEPSLWDWSGTPGTDGGVVTSPWCGEAAIWMWGTSSYWRHPNAASWSCTANSKYRLSAIYRTDGIIRFRLHWGSGATSDHVTTKESGYESWAGTVPAGETTWYLTVQMTSGTYAEVVLPCLRGVSTASSRQESIITAGTGLGAFSAPAYAEVSLPVAPFTDRLRCLVIGGIYQPFWSSTPLGASCTLAQMRLTNPSRTQRLFVRDLDDGNGIKLAYEQAGSELASAGFPISHALGDAYAWLFYAGRKTATPTWAVGGFIKRVGAYSAGGAANCEDVSSGSPWRVFDGLRFGGTGSSEQSANGILGGCFVASADYSQLSSFVDYLADVNVLDFWALTDGRVFHLTPSLSPRRWTRGYHTGVLFCSDVGSI